MLRKENKKKKNTGIKTKDNDYNIALLSNDIIGVVCLLDIDLE